MGGADMGGFNNPFDLFEQVLSSACTFSLHCVIVPAWHIPVQECSMEMQWHGGMKAYRKCKCGDQIGETVICVCSSLAPAAAGADSEAALAAVLEALAGAAVRSRARMRSTS